jgi:phage-related protein
MAINFTNTFPPFDVGFVEKEDSRFFSVVFEDNTIRADTEGGYETSRPRFTRRTRKTFTTGFTEMSQDDYAIIEEFWEEFGGSKAFAWVNQTNGITYSTRFTKAPTISYVGVGSYRAYNVEMELKEV